MCWLNGESICFALIVACLVSQYSVFSLSFAFRLTTRLTSEDSTGGQVHDSQFTT